MKEKIKKISDVLKTVFGYSVMITLLVGALSFLGYVAALIIGGEVAAVICDFVYNVILKVTIYASTVTILLGLVAMYLAGEKALTPNKRTKK